MIDPDELVVVTGSGRPRQFDAWIHTPDRDKLTWSTVHAAVEYRLLTRFAVVGGYDAATQVSPASTGRTA